MVFKNYHCNLVLIFLFVYIVHTHAGTSQYVLNINKIQAPPTKCAERKNCTSCIKNDINLQCYWCDNQCFSIMYLQKDCKRMKLNPEDICESDFTVGNSRIKTSNKYGFYNKPTLWTDSDYLLIAFCIVTLFIITFTLFIFYFIFEKFGEIPMIVSIPLKTFH